MRGGIWGLLVGDALGVPYEFHAASLIPPEADIEFEPPAAFERAHEGVLPGTWSDDGAQALCLLASLLHRNQLDVEDLGRRFINWLRHGYLAVDGNVFDVGITTSRAISAIERDGVAAAAGPCGEQDNGNGSLMRVLPLALWHAGTDDELAQDAMAQSRVTHGHLRSQLCCAVYCLWARRVLQKRADPWSEAVASVRSIFRGNAEALGELEGPIDVDRVPGGGGTGYVVDCLHSARACIEAGSYEAVVRAAVMLGNDTDTTAAVAGGIAGLRDGVLAIPLRWRDALRGRDVLDPLLARWRE